MEEVTSALLKGIAEQGLLFAVLLGILWGSFKRIWTWYWRVEELRVEYEKQLATAAERLKEAKEDKQWWQTQATQALGIAEGTVQTLKASPSDRRISGGGGG